MAPPSPRVRLSLTGYLFIGYALLLTLALAATGALWFAHHDREMEQQYTERVLAIARSVAHMPQIVEGFGEPDPAAVINPIAVRVTEATGAEYIVVADPEGIRYSHVDPRLVGLRVSTPPGPAARGEEWTGVQTGTQGRTVRAKVPVLSGEGGVLGYVSVGILVSDMETEAAAAFPLILGTTGGALLLGAGGAWALSRRLRAKTHGLEPAEITTLLEGREALLYAVREGVLAVDAAGRVVLVNRPAREMLGLPEDCEGTRLDGLGLPGRVLDVVSGADAGEDRIVLSGARVLVCNRMPVRIRGGDAGAVVTLRDRTELDRLTGELDGVRTATKGLRAQTHEFANRLHTLAGMLELGAHEEARAYLEDVSIAHARTSGDISARIADPAVAAITLAKSAQAAERGAELYISPMTLVPERMDAALRSDIVLVLGNLVDNALDSVAAAGPGGWVELLVRVHPRHGDGLPHDLVEVRVTDSGRGVAAELAEEIFEYGFTTKASRDGERGLGLALVRQVCESRGGSVRVQPPGEDADEGAVFMAYLPADGGPRPGERAAAGGPAGEASGGNGR
ncbi:sensor histidine kinase [Nocardiopsis sp. CNT-189]|uniref:ATP-binding protein n=1 Tax=Nocardiopsis oceanisediminis TaxID=2816862 RepID=UPI003B337726